MEKIIGDRIKTKLRGGGGGGLIELLRELTIFVLPPMSTNMASRRDEGPHPASYEDEEV